MGWFFIKKDVIIFDLQLYRGCIKMSVDLQVFWLWCGNAVYHSILLFWMTVVALEQGKSEPVLPDIFVFLYMFSVM